MRIQRGVAERQDRLRHVTTGGVDRDIVVLLEVDAGVLLARVVGSAKEITLEARVASTDDVLALNPPAFTATGATTDVTAAAAATAAAASIRSAVSIAVEATAPGAAPRLRLGARAIFIAAAAAAAAPVVATATSAGIEVVIANDELELIER
jgi:hypothetical protein